MPSPRAYVQVAVTAMRAATGATPALNGFSGGTEAAFLCRAYGMPMVICGPGQLADGHTVNESVAVAELQRAVATYAHVAWSLLG
ncbi:MAG TPA: M20/M25/M40 family metallo-hydrolase [Actinomycetes bacterium]|nr:M20/M25/M40 family metallo-hydrolase [Actinomycetes bacterium]